jgi:hypothetical protein
MFGGAIDRIFATFRQVRGTLGVRGWRSGLLYQSSVPQWYWLVKKKNGQIAGGGQTPAIWPLVEEN